MKKIFLVSVISLGAVAGVFSMISKDNVVSAENPELAPCKKHYSQCPPGYSGGYECRKGIPTLPDCLPAECGTIHDCEPDN